MSQRPRTLRDGRSNEHKGSEKTKHVEGETRLGRLVEGSQTSVVPSASSGMTPFIPFYAL